MNKKTCRLCDKLVVAKGLCGMHYRRWRTHGDPNIVKKGKPYSRYPDCPNRCGYKTSIEGQPCSRCLRRVYPCDGFCSNCGKWLKGGSDHKRCWDCETQYRKRLAKSRRRRCKVDGCCNLTGRKDRLCKVHAERKRVHGDPTIVKKVASYSLGTEKKIKIRTAGGETVIVKTIHGWERKARVIFEAAFGVRLLEKDVILHKNNDAMDFQVENLVLQSRAKRVVVCDHCGRAFMRDRRNVKRFNYCPICTKGKVGGTKGLRKTKIKLCCQTCGKSIWKYPSQVKKSRTGFHYCSTWCAYSDLSYHFTRVYQGEPSDEESTEVAEVG